MSQRRSARQRDRARVELGAAVVAVLGDSTMSGLSVLTFVFAGSRWLNTMVAPTDAVASAWPGSTMTGAGSPGRAGW
ncbi:MAG: hypothetical protein WCA82_11115, partial [Jiangellales bacterium]